MKCTWCMSEEHTVTTCPKVAAFKVATEHGIVDPMTADEINDHVALRLFRERAAKGQYRKLCLDAGILIPETVLEIDPDRHTYEAA